MKIKKFVIHQHNADKAGLHYDIRLEKDGVLKSWAGRKLPDLIKEKEIRIYVVQTPDHNFKEWINFQGTIKTDYGKGDVKIFDKGTYQELEWTKNKIKVRFNGTKIKGIYVFIKYEDGYLLVKQKKKE